MITALASSGKGMGRFGQSRRGISKLKATLILIALVLLAALLLYMMFTRYAAILIGRGQVVIVSIDLVGSTEGDYVFTCTVKNTGNKPAKRIAVRLASEPEVEFPGVSQNSPLEPGRSTAIVLVSGSSLTGDYVGGQIYSVTVSATFLDGSMFATTSSVMCLGGGKPRPPPPPGQVKKYLYFGYTGSARVVRVNSSTFTITTSQDYGYDEIDVLAWDGDWVYAYALSGDDRIVVKIDPASLSVVASVVVTDYGWLTAIAPSGKYIYVLDSAGEVFKIDIPTFSVVGNLNLWETYGYMTTADMAADKAGKYLYVSVREGMPGGVVKVEIPDLTIMDDHWFADDGYVWLLPDTIAVADGHVYITEKVLGRLLKLDATTLELEGVITYGESYAEVCVVHGKLFLVYDYQYDSNQRFYVARVDLNSFTLEDKKVYELQSSSPTVYSEFRLWTDGKYLYCPRQMEDGTFIVEVYPMTLEQVDRAGPLQP